MTLDESIFTPLQLEIWQQMGHLPEDIVLCGGTAVALLLSHRASDGFDFYVDCECNQAQLLKLLSFLKEAQWSVPAFGRFNALLEYKGETIRFQFMNGLHQHHVKRPLHADNHPAVCSLEDSLAVKLFGICERAFIKDYVDIDALLLSGLSLAEGLGAAKALFGNMFDPLSALKALSHYRDGNLSEIDKAVKNRLIAQAVSVEDVPLVKLAI